MNQLLNIACVRKFWDYQYVDFNSVLEFMEIEICSLFPGGKLDGERDGEVDGMCQFEPP
jgi:hypothetical protein